MQLPTTHYFGIGHGLAALGVAWGVIAAIILVLAVAGALTLARLRHTPAR